ncbi:hypothetical protein ACIA5G_09055 [Amycolatopsis sp. NPDC051758]|uniref:hypothetical protein n=1 Tax=Amycolatopsis sp. NPDC051758 TaxID=3363935 RepID=UPI0037A73F79
MNRVQLLLGAPDGPTNSPTRRPGQQLLRRQRPEIPGNRRLPDRLHHTLDGTPGPSPHSSVRDLPAGTVRKPLGRPAADRAATGTDDAADRARDRSVLRLGPVPALAVTLRHLQTLDARVHAEVDGLVLEDLHADLLEALLEQFLQQLLRDLLEPLLRQLLEQLPEQHLHGHPGGDLGRRDARRRAAERHRGRRDHRGDLGGQHDQRDDDHVLRVLDVQGRLVARIPEGLRRVGQLLEVRLVAFDELLPLLDERVGAVTRPVVANAGSGLVARVRGRAEGGGRRVPRVA